MKTISRVVVIHGNVLLAETLSNTLVQHLPDCEVTWVTCVGQVRVDHGQTLFIIDAELITDPENAPSIESIRQTRTNKIINLSTSARTMAASQLTEGASCWVSSQDGIGAIVEAIKRADNHDSFVSPTRIKLSTGRGVTGLTKRELQCCTYCLYDLADVSARLGLNKNSVRTYFERARIKLSLENQQQLIAWAVLNGIAHIPMDAEDIITGRRSA